MLGWVKRRRRARLRAAPFPPAWRDVLRRNVPLYQRLPEADRRELEGHVQVFLAEKHFEGCGGLELTDEMRVTIAAQASLLLLHRDTDYYPGLYSVLVYPSDYVADVVEESDWGLVTERRDPRSGEAWPHGVVVLSWDDVRTGAADPRDGENLVLHEFAHQLDQESGGMDGAPLLGHPTSYVAWARVLGGEFEALRQASYAGAATLLDEYGAVSPAEFFAVATESFFERPVALRRRHPELYQELRRFYRQDPARLAEGPAGDERGSGDGHGDGPGGAGSRPASPR